MKFMLQRFRQSFLLWYSGYPNRSLFNDDSILAILTDVEAEGSISWEPLAVHSCEHWTLSVDVIVDFN